MAVLTAACGHHCVASKSGEGPNAHLTVKHCPCPECHSGRLSASVITGSAVGPGGVSMAVGWGDQGVAEAVAITEEGKADDAALAGVREEMVEEAVTDLHHDLDQEG